MNVPNHLIGGRYRVVREIAAGGMGTVYEAQHALSKKSVALKIMHSHIARKDSAKERFLREVSAPAHIGHDGIVDVYDAGVDETDGSVFFAMELLSGETMRARLERGGLTVSEILGLFDQLLDALAAAHEKSIVHRDLKPENVFLVRRRDGRTQVKLVDFGIVRAIGEESSTNLTQAGTAMGTPEYMSPEQATNARDVTAATDVWAVGVMLYEALGGRTPFTGQSPTAVVVDVLTRPHAPLATIAPSVPRPIVEVVERCLAKDPTGRPPDARSLLALLRHAATAAELPPTLPMAAATSSPSAASGAYTSPISGVGGVGPTGGPGFGGPASPTPYGTSPGPFSAPGGQPGGAATAPGPYATGPAPSGFGTPSPSSGGGFGAPANSGFGTPSPSSGGGFGTPSPSSGGGFGTPSPSSGGGFGGPSPTPGAAPAGSFGAPAQQRPKRGRGLFIAIGVLVVGLGIAGIGGVALFASGALGEPDPGQVRCVTTLTGASLFVDGTDRGPLSAGRVIELPVGMHVLEARVGGQTVVTQNVAVQTGVMVDVTLETPVQRFAGRLEAGDRQLNSGEYQDQFNFTWEVNRSVHVEANSTEFDTYLIVKRPDGQQWDNDDPPGGTSRNAALDIVTPVPGAYQILVTSYQPGEVGGYELVVRPQ